MSERWYRKSDEHAQTAAQDAEIVYLETTSQINDREARGLENKMELVISRSAIKDG